MNVLSFVGLTKQKCKNQDRNSQANQYFDSLCALVSRINKSDLPDASEFTANNITLIWHSRVKKGETGAR